jgi:putative peptide zinc metalloprotease protein
MRIPPLAVLVASLLLGAPAGAAPTQAQVEPTATSTPEILPAEDPEALPTLTAEEAAQPDEPDEADGVVLKLNGIAKGAKNVVKLKNRVDGRLRVKGSVQLNQIQGQNVGPINLAQARASCLGCQTIAVALQISLYERHASRVVPRNNAEAVNVGCFGCFTVARSIQYVYPVDDPTQVPPEIDQLIRAMDKELKELHSQSHSLTVAEAVARINVVLAEFTDLAAYVYDQQVEEQHETTSSVEETPTPAP